MLVDQRDALGAEALDLEQLQQRGRELREQRIALFKRSALGSSSSTLARPLPTPGISVTLRSGLARMSSTRSGKPSMADAALR